MRGVCLYLECACVDRAGLQTEVQAMEATRFLDEEDNFLVWDTADKVLAYTSLMLSRYSSSYGAFQVILSIDIQS